MNQDFHSSPDDLEIFKDSAIWHDISILLNLYIESGRDYLESAVEHKDIIAVQAEIKTARLLLGLPDSLKSILEKEKVNGSTS